MRYVLPSFEIDNKGRVLCKKHSEYSFFKLQHKSYYQERRMENLLTCKTCIHYEQNDCYFPREEINKIEFDREKRNRFKCVLCGNRIDRMLTIIQKLYYEEKFNVKIPLICCICYETLKNGTFLEFFSKRFFISIMFDLFSIFFLFSEPFPFNVVNFALYITFTILLKVLLKKVLHLNIFLHDLIKGKKYYNKYFNQNEKLT